MIYLFLLTCLLIVSMEIFADQMVHKFKSPAFNGDSTSSHYLTIENQETNRKEAIEEEIKALQDEIARTASNTVEARFLRNLTSRVYAELARQIEEKIFGETKSTSGSMQLEGNTISYKVTDDLVEVTIISEDGNVTAISVPIGDFTF